MRHQRRFLRLFWSLVNCAVLMVAGSSLLAAPLHQPVKPDRVSTIQRIRDRGNILAAGVPYDFPPFGSENANGDLVGFDIDLMTAMAKLWGVELELVKVTADARIPLLVAGEIDIIAAAMTHTQDRETEIDFSQTYFVDDGQSLLVRKQSGVNSVLDLADKRVGAIQGTTSIVQIVDYAQDNSVRIDIVPFAEYLPALDALQTGTIEALTSDRSALTQFARRNTDLEVVGQPFSRELYGLGVQAGDSLFRHLVDSTLQQMKINGLYNEIYSKWFPSLEPHPITSIPGIWPYIFETSPENFNFAQPSIVELVQREHQLKAGVLVDSPPLSMLDRSGKCCVGFGVDLVKEFARRWTGDKSTVELVPIVSADQSNNTNFKQWDIFVTSLPQTWELEAVMDFSQPYLAAKNLTSAQIDSDASISFGLPPGDDQFRDLVNFTIQAMASDCTYQQLYQKWFPGTASYPIEIWPGKPADPFIWNMVKSTNSICPEIQMAMPLTAYPAISPSVTQTSITVGHTTTIFTAETEIVTAQLTTTLANTGAIQIASSEQMLLALDVPPQDYPNTGGSMYSYRLLPFIVLLIGSLFGSAIYQKYRQEVSNKN